MRRQSVLVLVACAAGVAGCQQVLGMDESERKAYLGGQADSGPGDSGSGDTAVGDTGTDVTLPPGCALPSQGETAIRVGNMVPNRKRYDICYKATSVSSFQGIKPLLASSGADCPKGIGYHEITAPIAVNAGSYDIKLVEAGAVDCSGAPLAAVEQALVEQGLGKTTAFYLLGDGTSAAILRRFPESVPDSPLQGALRLIHASYGLPNLDLGVVASGKEVPEPLTFEVFHNVAYGLTATPGGGVDADGYKQAQQAGVQALYAVRKTGEPTAQWSRMQKIEYGKSYTFFMTGALDRPEFPPELLACSTTETVGALTKCGGTPYNLTATLYGTLLNGLAFKHEGQRRPMVRDVVSKMNTDAVCLWDVFSDSDKKSLIEAAKSHYPYSYAPETNWSTPANDSTTLDGKIPEPYTEGPCSKSTAKLEELTTCLLAAKCVSPLDDTGKIVESQFSTCMVACLAKIVPMMTGSIDDQACWSCAANMLNGYETIGAAKESCTTNKDARLAFRGAQSFVMMSKAPFAATPEVYLLPSWEWRTAVLRAPIRLDNGATVDLYCGNLTHIPPDCGSRPYAGPYGDGKTCDDGAFAIQKANQVQKLLTYIHSTATVHNRPAIIMLDADSGPSAFDGDKQILKERDLATYNSLLAKLAPAFPSNYAPRCSFCNDNPWNGGTGADSGVGLSLSHIFLNGIPVTSVQSLEITQKDASYEFAEEGGSTSKRPASYYYGVTATLRLTP